MSDFERARKFMVDNQLRTSGITDWRILAVMSDVPREMFVPEARRAVAYGDVDQPLGSSRYLSAAAPFAKLVQLAEIGPTDTVLDIGAGSGYSTAVLAGLAASVTGVESDAGLAAAAAVNLSALGITNAKVVQGAPEAGVKGQFSVIVVEGAIAAVPQALLGQLADGGRLVALLQDKGPAVAHIYVRSGKDTAGRAEFNANLPPLQFAKREEHFVF
ncbi:protein-L-isoaspartate O-methyltransferase [Devosia sp.]|uniref:protein-L-isoaspartate O-methyltransferase family protein n=1 Tax=Devosia sp. TaxID=1871048 RepID=UPI00326676FE